MYKENDQCPICGEGKLTLNSRSENFNYRGHHRSVSDFEVFSCSNCDEEIVPESSMKKSEKILRDFHREIDGLLTSSEIKKIRTSYGFSQNDFSRLLGLGAKTFSRYENCTVTQNRTTDHLLRIIDVMPEALDVICGTQSITSSYTVKKTSNSINVPVDSNLVYHYKLGD